MHYQLAKEKPATIPAIAVRISPKCGTVTVTCLLVPTSSEAGLFTSTLAGLKSYFIVWKTVLGEGLVKVDPSFSSRTSESRFRRLSIFLMGNGYCGNLPAGKTVSPIHYDVKPETKTALNSILIARQFPEPVATVLPIDFYLTYSICHKITTQPRTLKQENPDLRVREGPTTQNFPSPLRWSLHADSEQQEGGGTKSNGNNTNFSSACCWRGEKYYTRHATTSGTGSIPRDPPSQAGGEKDWQGFALLGQPGTAAIYLLHDHDHCISPPRDVSSATLLLVPWEPFAQQKRLLT